MRITTWNTAQHRLGRMMESQSRLATLQVQVSSGKRLTRPSDDPAAGSELLPLQTRLAERQQRMSGIDSASPLMAATESALADIGTALASARTAGQGANNAATVSPAQRAALAAQVRSAAQTVFAKANTELGGRYLFGGTVTDSAPFSAGPPVVYTGNDTPVQIGLQAEGEPFAVTFTGNELRDAQGGGDLFANLSQLATAIESGDQATVQTTLTKVEKNFDRIVQLRGDMGARMNYVSMTRESLDREVLSLQERQSKLVDVDLGEAIVKMQAAENTHQAALAVAGRLGSGPQLLDYLR